MMSQSWVTILDPLEVVDDLGRWVVPRRVRVSVGGSLALVVGRGTKKEANFLSVSHVFEIPHGG